MGFLMKMYLAQNGNIMRVSVKLLIIINFIFILSGCLGDYPVSLFGFRTSPYFSEQELVFKYSDDVRIYINAPSAERFSSALPTNIVIYALPNGNTIEQTAGKIMKKGDDWHYDIQHIAAQTRFLRNQAIDYNLVIAYLECSQKSWPSWKRIHGNDHPELIISIIDSLRTIFSDYHPYITLSGHSGGGSFVNGFIEANHAIPHYIDRITFLDSNYGYNKEIGKRLKVWLDAGTTHKLCVLAYNDSVALYKGKPFVSDTGGTWYRSKMMVQHLQNNIKLNFNESCQFITYKSNKNRVEVFLKKNPERKIFHTHQVAYNGFIHCLLSGTALEEKEYEYFGEPVYSNFISGMVPAFRPSRFPDRRESFQTIEVFIKRIENLSFDEREELIRAEILKGNFPEFLRDMVVVEYNALDSCGFNHHIRFEVMPDYLSIGSDSTFLRMPMGPITAQVIADSFGAVLPTSRLVNIIYEKADCKVKPYPFKPTGDLNSEVSRFIEHNDVVQMQLDSNDCIIGDLIAGHKKDIVTSTLIYDPRRVDHVAIYGWHRLDGTPIQPLTNIHINWYVDYSHGIRLINSEIFVDGFPKDIRDVWSDSVLYKLVSDEILPKGIRY